MKRLNRPEPPIVHAEDHWDPDQRQLTYTYHGRTMISLHLPGDADIRWRVHSDGEMQSDPFIQQIYLTVLEVDRLQTQATFTLSEEALCMRPHRARAEQAVLGQVGRPLVSGVNGLYDVLDDLLIDWHGRPWKWADQALRRNADGTLSATVDVELGYRTWIINLRPHYYREHLGYKHHEPWNVRPKTKSVSGWCSWEAYRRKITQENVLEASDFMAEHFKPYGFEYMQIDDGFQETPIGITPEKTWKDAWLTSTEAFPGGLAAVADGIRERGLVPGIWMNTDMRQYETPGGEEDCILREADGSPLKPAFMGTSFDCTPEHVERHFNPIIKALRDLGFDYIKVDALRHTIYDALQAMVRKGLLTNQEARERFRAIMAGAREAMGDDAFYLVSWGVFSEAIGLCDGCRIATDSNPAWRKVRMQIVEQARWFHSQRILFINDPDHICCRTKPDWGKTLLSNVSLTGGMMMLSDPIASYDEQRVYNVQRCMPPLETFAAETGALEIDYQAYAWTKLHGVLFTGEIELGWQEIPEEDAVIISGDHPTMDHEHPFGSLWATHFATEAGTWCVAQRVANLPLPASRISVENLGLDPAKTYLAYDFWAGAFLGEVRGTIDVPALELGYGQVIAFRERLDHPRFLASTRHVSMGAVGIRGEAWDADGTLTLEVEGVEGAEETYRFHCPVGWNSVEAFLDDQPVAIGPEGEIVSCAVAASPSGSVLRLRFAR